MEKPRVRPVFVLPTCRYRTEEPHGDGADDAQPRDRRWSGDRHHGRALQPARIGRLDHLRIDTSFRPGARLSEHAQHVHRRAVGGLAACRQCRAFERRPDLRAVATLRPRIASELPGGRRAARRAVRHPPCGAVLYEGRLSGLRNAARARNGRDRRCCRPVQDRGGICACRRLRRDRGAWRQRLPDRPVPARWQQPAR